MNEALKTLLYVAAAVAVVTVAAVTYPRQEEFEMPDVVGESLFADFTDPEKAAELQILKFREDMGEFSEFEVARNAETGLWVIPSSGNYPADAEAQMREAASSLVDVKVLGIASEMASEHETYGVIEPRRQMDRSQSGVGLLVNVKDQRGAELAELIIGKRVKGTVNQHFVRKPGIDSVYVAKINPEYFPTDFQQWIERDLLRLNALDIDHVTVKDYAVVKQETSGGPRGTIYRRFEADVNWDEEANRWVLNELVQDRDGERVPTTLLDTEEINSERLDQLASVLDDLKIVGVMRKPMGLGADLKAGSEFANDQESLLSLASRGFYLIRFSGVDPELYAANGELIVGLSNGVEYVLRFGGIADVAGEAEEGRLSRYLFVTARLNESQFPPLDLQPLPDETAIPEDASVGEQSDLALRRERIRKENQRQIDQREEQLREAQRRVDELNARFADWYYIISEDQYKLVHLNKHELIRESADAAEEGFGIDAFRQLRREGIDWRPEELEQSEETPRSLFSPSGPPR